MQMSQVSLPLDEGSMKFTLSEDRRQELGGVVQFHDYYETGPEQGVRDMKRGDSSKQDLLHFRSGACTRRYRVWKLHQHCLPALWQAKTHECSIPAIECECCEFQASKALVGRK